MWTVALEKDRKRRRQGAGERSASTTLFCMVEHWFWGKLGCYSVEHVDEYLGRGGLSCVIAAVRSLSTVSSSDNSPTIQSEWEEDWCQPLLLSFTHSDNVCMCTCVCVEQTNVMPCGILCFRDFCAANVFYRQKAWLLLHIFTYHVSRFAEWLGRGFLIAMEHY